MSAKCHVWTAPGWQGLSSRRMTSAPHLLPITSLLAGLFLLLAPRVVSFAVAVYLIFVGLLGLNGIYHLFK